VFVKVKTPALGMVAPVESMITRLSFGEVKLGRLKTLNISVRNCALNDSEILGIGMFLNSEKSISIRPGPISPFRPRRWSGAILPDDTCVCFRVHEPENRPVSAVADQFEIRDVAQVDVTLDRERSLTLLFDPEHALDERIAMEQFAT